MAFDRQLRRCSRCKHEIGAPDGATPEFCPACGIRLDPSSPNNSSDERGLTYAPLTVKSARTAIAALVVGILSLVFTLYGFYCILRVILIDKGVLQAQGGMETLALGAVAVMFWAAGAIFGIVAMLLGLRARHEIARSPGRSDGRYMAVAGVVLGSIGVGAPFLFCLVGSLISTLTR